MGAKLTSFRFWLEIPLLVMAVFQTTDSNPMLGTELEISFQPEGMILMHLNTPGLLKIMYMLLPPLPRYCAFDPVV